ncbi:hypothetical protein [uncultured Methanobrevibacter sp.]|uniref:hypothetical protein n=1 Tax=uncultured Methanobrevibacter sp. TaxID=253161 RepID=UPI002639B5C8|nr:hypothetical protein [uncultured Methanobrevibacter sp.]
MGEIFKKRSQLKNREGNAPSDLTGYYALAGASEAGQADASSVSKKAFEIENANDKINHFRLCFSSLLLYFY